MDPRYEALARSLIRYSLKLRKKEIILIEHYDEIPHEMVIALVREVRKVGGRPIVWSKHRDIMRAVMMEAEGREFEITALGERTVMAAADAYIGWRGYSNVSEWADVPPEKMELFNKLWYDPVHMKQRIGETRWVVGRWPTPSMAQQAGMSTAGFVDYYFQVCLVNYAALSKAMLPLKRLMEQTDRVQIKGPGTDLHFSLKGIPAQICSGQINIPDGELFSAPVRESINGQVTFNVEAEKDCQKFGGIRLVFKNGKIVEESCQTGDRKRLTKILDTDGGARYTGEFSFGVNPKITRPIGDTLFDEKISGSFHLTPGNCYESAPNGNHSAIHFDIICIQTPEYGGGSIYFDGQLIRKDGLFVPRSLQGLNPDRLTKA